MHARCLFVEQLAWYRSGFRLLFLVDQWAPRNTSNLGKYRRQEGYWCVMWDVRCEMSDVRCVKWDVRCEMWDVTLRCLWKSFSHKVPEFLSSSTTRLVLCRLPRTACTSQQNSGSTSIGKGCRRAAGTQRHIVEWQRYGSFSENFSIVRSTTEETRNADGIRGGQIVEKQQTSPNL